MLPYTLPLMHAAPATPTAFPSRDQRANLRFWLKPHLRDFVRHINGGSTFDLQDTNVIGCMALSCLTPKTRRAYRSKASFSDGRMPLDGSISGHMLDMHGFIQERVAVEGNISLFSASVQGCIVASYSRFEFLVEHLFHHLLLVHVDAMMSTGDSQNNAIRSFLDRYGIEAESIEFATLKKTVSRRRSRMRVA